MLGLATAAATPTTDATARARPSAVAAKRASRRSMQLVVQTFRWVHASREVFVSGSFNGWAAPVRLRPMTREGDQEFEVSIPIDRAVETVFKFIVDGVWRCGAYPTKVDENGNVNNVLPPIRSMSDYIDGWRSSAILDWSKTVGS